MPVKKSTLVRQSFHAASYYSTINGSLSQEALLVHSQDDLEFITFLSMTFNNYSLSKTDSCFCV